MGQGNSFSSVCQEFCSQGGLPHCMLGYTPPRTDTPREQTPPIPSCSAYWEIRTTSGQFASYWNAILLTIISIGSYSRKTSNKSRTNWTNNIKRFDDAYQVHSPDHGGGRTRYSDLPKKGARWLTMRIFFSHTLDRKFSLKLKKTFS